MLARLPPWSSVAPVVGLVGLGLALASKPPTAALAVAAVVLAATVLSAVHHAEVIAHRVGEPLGSLILALAVTVIEVGLIIMLMLAGDRESTATLARDTVFAAAMIATNGILGLVLLVGALRRRFATFNAEGTGTALGTVLTLATLCLVLPSFTTTVPGPQLSSGQLAFAAISSLALFGLYVLVQTVRHPDAFVGEVANVEHKASEDAHGGSVAVSAGLLVAALVAVVGLAKVVSPAIEDGVAAIGAPESAVGVVIALVVLAPETFAALANARRNDVQAGLNLALGSAMASIGLTIPAIAVASIWLDGPLSLGLDPTQIVLLAITGVVGALTVIPGRATVQQGGLHLVLFGAFLVLAVAP